MASPFASQQRRSMLAGLLTWTMVAATAATVTLPVVATFIIDEFDISRAAFGFLLASLTAVNALVSPWVGRITDKVGGRTAMVAVFVSSAGAAVAYAVAPTFPAMFIGSVLSLAGAATNPATNKLIAAYVPAGRRGMITGVKQTGPQIGSLIAGLAAPLGAALFGWRPTVALIAAFSLAAIPLVYLVIPADERRDHSSAPTPGRLPSGVGWLSMLALVLGIGGSSALLIPLFAEEGLGLSNRVAGLAAAVQGGVAIFGRVAWAGAAERIRSQWIPTAVIALVAIVSSGFMLLALSAGTGWLWVGSTLSGLSAGAWTAAGAIAVITLVGESAAGRATGWVWGGFLTGLSIGPPLLGWVVDRTDSYAAMWWTALGFFVVLGAAALAWGASPDRNPSG